MPEANDNSSDEQVWEEQRSQRIKFLKEANPDAAKQVESLTHTLEGSLLSYLLRPDSDPQVINLLHNLIGSLDLSLHFGKSDEALSQSRLAEIKAALVGSAAVLDPSIERASPVRPLEYLDDATRFLKLTESRVGKIDSTTGDAEIRMRQYPSSPNQTIQYRSK